MRIAACSDLHGTLPVIPDCDVAVFAGDISPNYLHKVTGDIDHNADASWLYNDFAALLLELTERKIVAIGVAGNHDILAENDRFFFDSLPWIYLQDEGISLGGVKFWGTPWQPFFQNWSFNAPEFDQGEEFLHEKFNRIPDDVDVVISHSPPAGILDKTGGRHVGSVALNRALQRVNPTLAVFGHVHMRYGVETIGATTCANVAVTDYDYRLVREPIVFDI